MKSLILSVLTVTLASSTLALAHDETGPAPSNSPAPTTPAATTSSNTTLANAVAARTPEEMAAQSGLQLVFALDHWLGVGTFVDPKLYSSLSVNLAFAPQYLFSVKGVKLAASLLARVTYEYTLPDVETGRRWSFYDTRLGLSAPSFFKEKVTGIGFSPSFGLTLPTSPESFSAGFLFAASLGLSATRSFDTRFGGLDFRLGVGGARSINRSSVNAVSPSNPNATDSAGNLLVLCRSGESACGYAGQNTAYSGNVGASANWRATGELVLNVSYTFIKAWKEPAATTVDQFTPKALTGDGTPAAHTGYGEFDRTFAVVDASYQVNENYSVDLSVSTIQTPLTGTRGVRFPWFSFGSLADNNTSVNFTLTAAY